PLASAGAPTFSPAVQPGAPVAPPAPPAGPTEAISEASARRAGPVRQFFLRHPNLVDALVVAWYLVPAVLTVALPAFVGGLAQPELSASEKAVTVAVVVLSATALVWRRRAPVTVLVVTTVLLAISLAVTANTSGCELSTVLALYAVAAYRPATTAWLALAGLNVVTVTASYLWLDPTAGGTGVTMTTGDSEQITGAITTLQLVLIVSITTLVLSVVAVGVGTAARGRRLHVEGLVERTHQLVLERDQREQIAVSAERARIAREMHDVVAHSLSVMITLADGASAALTRSPDQARAALDQLAETGRSALADTRRMVGVLREDHHGPAPAGPGDDTDPDGVPLAPQPDAHDVADLVQRFRATGLPVRLSESGPSLPSDAGLQLAVYRIVQECLTNVLRYARLSPRIDVAIERGARSVSVTVDNDSGSAGDALVGSGRGLIGIRERVAVYDGCVEAGPTASGWRVRAELNFEEGRR
ncbi:sensor histidine kinase, partial [Georgenia subflava]